MKYAGRHQRWCEGTHSTKKTGRLPRECQRDVQCALVLGRVPGQSWFPRGDKMPCIQQKGQLG